MGLKAISQRLTTISLSWAPITITKGENVKKNLLQHVDLWLGEFDLEIGIKGLKFLSGKI